MKYGKPQSTKREERLERLLSRGVKLPWENKKDNQLNSDEVGRQNDV